MDHMLLNLRDRLRSREGVERLHDYLDHIANEEIQVPPRHVIDLRDPQTALRSRAAQPSEGQDESPRAALDQRIPQPR
ncbi:MAG: hypothetical protein JWO22_2815 [Frankiales bacterium]|nr:hypothetical protein [Frankiales bacterium]